MLRKSGLILQKSIGYIQPHYRKLFTKTKTMSAFNYPSFRRDETIKDTYFGTEIPDPYRWLEDPDSEETQNFVKAQNELTRPYLDSCPQKKAIQERITKLWNFPKKYCPTRHGNKYYQHRNTGLQNQNVLFVLDELTQEGKVFLDPNTLSDDGTIALSGTKFSEDGSTFAYGLSSSGSDWIEIRFKNALTGEDYPEVLKKVKFSSMSWMHDNKGFFYCAYLDQTGKADGSETTSSENQKVYYHVLGTDQSADVEAVEFEDKELRIGCRVSHCGSYLVVTATKGCKNNLLYFARVDPAQKVTGKLPLTPVVTNLDADYEYITNIGSKFFFRTNKNALNYRIVGIDFNNPEESQWTDLIQENPENVLDYAHVINETMLLVTFIKDVKHSMHLFDLNSGKKVHDFKLDVGTVMSVSGKKNHKEMFYSFASFLTPNSIYRVTFDGDKINEEKFHETQVGDLDTSIYETKQVFYKSKDGTTIPMFLVSKKGVKQDGTNPCLLYGYGGFNISLMPSFSVSRLIFVNNFNGIYALANIRGGGEYGDKWHNGGRFENKQNCFDDFQHAAKYLVEEKYTSANKLTIQGGSNGGLLVAACINQAPELFGAAIAQVGVLDMLRYHKFTIGYAWKSDYGCSDLENEFKYILKYSPLHNIKVPENGAQYPATLLLTADHDDRVVPLHSLKFIAELQHKIGHLSQQTNPLLIRVETKAGHGAGKPTSKIIEELTDIFCFISNSLKVKFVE
ncbi:prolyl endopeptidase isoform X2 [Anthonomus grandis grandis]|uniref:prolyl endopeptidase isoform X2 n=1 Tax=Anthonomus grandis grandis TaxID=2921223 RepID=UPI0021655E1F|nr:prolyl endopeptidase isoform X2 [Anthonomus grandis grandis]